MKGLKFEPAKQDMEEILAAQENLLNLSGIISRDWTLAVEEDNSYVKIYPDPRSISCRLQGFSFNKGN